MRSVPREFRPLVKAACAAGWRISRRNAHLWLWAPYERTTVSVPCSPSDGRAVKNTRAELRRAGVNV